MQLDFRPRFLVNQVFIQLYKCRKANSEYATLFSHLFRLRWLEWELSKYNWLEIDYYYQNIDENSRTVHSTKYIDQISIRSLHHIQISCAMHWKGKIYFKNSLKKNWKHLKMWHTYWDRRLIKSAHFSDVSQQLLVWSS